jgi:uncharacterized pyridoxamine 5'-phosphate oxidase family protein
MDRAEVLEAIKNSPFAFLSTTEGGEPRVRAMEMYRVDQDGVIFYTSKRKDVYKQIEKNPVVEICVFDNKAFKEVRIRGKMESLEDVNLKKEICSKREFLNYLGKTEKEICDALAVMQLKGGKAMIWTMADTSKSSTYFDF